MEEKKYNKILLTHDGSAFASSAIVHAASIARSFNSMIILVHVTDSIQYHTAMINSQTFGMYPLVSTGIEDSIIQENKKKARIKMEEIRKEFKLYGVKNVDIVIEEGQAEDVILDTSENENCDLIVMSTHGRSGIIRAVLGSVTDYVVRHATCPVLIVRPTDKSILQQGFEKGGE